MGLRDSIRSLDEYLDKKVSDVPDMSTRRRTETPEEYEARIKGTLRTLGRKTKTTIKSIDGYGDKATGKLSKRKGKGIEGLLDWTLGRPLMTIIILVVIAMGIGTQAIYIVDNMRGDMEIYLPPGDPSTVTMTEVREDWSIDVIVLLIETKDNNGDGRRDDVTDRDILVEMSFVEGDATNDLNTDPFRGLDWDRNDRGVNDGFTFALSLSTVIKVINETAGNVAQAIEEEFGLGQGVIPSVPGEYSIPDQDTIDQIVSRISPEDMEKFAKDTDGDGTRDTASIMLGVAAGQKPAEIVKRVDDIVKARSEGLKTNITLCTMTNTGPYTVIEKMQGRTVTEFTKILPTMILVLAIVLYFFHRNFKVVVVALFPVVLALIITLGLTGFISEYIPGFLVISPQIALILPVMISLGISYGLYVSNQFVEEKEGTPEERVKRAVKKQHNAILLSAGTTALGFGSLMVGTLPPIVTMGFALAIGIMLTYAFTMIISPPIVVLLKYKKMIQYGTFKAIRTVPSNNRKKIVTLALLAVLVSVILIPLVRFDADFLAMMPSDDPSIRAMNRYSKDMGGGQLGMILVRADVKDYDTLKYVDRLSSDIDKVENSKSLSIVSIMKMIQTPDNITIPRYGQINLPRNVSFWDVIGDPKFAPIQENLINIFYNSLSYEMRLMFVNNDGDKMLIYVFMPYMDISKTERAVNGVNDAIATKGNPPMGTVSDLTGVASMQIAVNNLLIVSQFQSLALCIVLSMVILIVVFRNWKLGTLTIIPCCIVVGLEPLVMVGMDIPLSLVTVMIGSIAVGTGVDFSIQISQRLNIGGMTIPNIHSAVENLGTSFIEATSTMVLGFSAVLFAPWPGHGPYGLPVTFGIAITSVQQFVEMIMILLCFNAVMALFVHSAILTIWFRARKKEEMRQKRMRQLEKESIRRARAEMMTVEDLDDVGGAGKAQDIVDEPRDEDIEGYDDERLGLEEDGTGEELGEEEVYDDGDIPEEGGGEERGDDGYSPPVSGSGEEDRDDRGRGRGRGRGGRR